MGLLQFIRDMFIDFLAINNVCPDSDINNDKTFEIVDKIKKKCPRCQSIIQIDKRFCPWCGYTDEKGIISEVSNWKSEADLYKEKRAEKLKLPFGEIDQYLYELLEKVSRCFSTNINNIFSDYEKQGYKELVALGFLRELTSFEIINRYYTLKELRIIAKEFKIKISLPKNELLQKLLENKEIESKLLIPIQQKYAVEYTLNTSVADYFENKAQKEKIIQEQQEQTFINLLKNNPDENPLYVSIKKQKRPEILAFLNEEDYNYVIFLYVLTNKIKSYKLKEYFTKPYNYTKGEWAYCVDCLQQYENFISYTKFDIEQMKNSGIKKVELICHENCICCKKILDKPISINKIKEIPIKDCPDDIICSGTYVAVLDYED